MATNQRDAKLFEIRDEGTCISALAVHIDYELMTGRRAWIVGRVGYKDNPYVLLTNLCGLETQYDPYKWGHGRTMREAHLYILENWFTLPSATVIDVRFIKGETKFVCKSDCPY